MMSRYLVFVGLVVGLVMNAAAIAQAPAEHFARLPAAKGVSISPDGTRMAFIGHAEDNTLLIVQDLETGEQIAASADGLRVFDTFWAGDNTVLARVGTLIDVARIRGDVDVEAFITFDADTLEGRELVRRRLRDGMNFDTTRIAGIDPETGHFFMTLRDERRRLNLYTVDPATGYRSRIRERGHQNTRYWVADPTGQRFVEVRYSDRNSAFEIRVHDTDGERVILQRDSELITLTVMGFTEDGDILVSRRPNEPPFTRQLQRLDPITGELGDVIFRDERYDFGDVRMDYHEGHVAGVYIERERSEYVWFDEELAARQASLENAFPGATVSLIDWSLDRTRFLVSTTTNAQPPVYYIVDFAAGGADPVRLAYPELYGVELVGREPIYYPARDGVQVPAYLAQPAGDGPQPYVILVHGGPHSRDTGGFDYLAHFLADRGYGVLQPQFRGSDGYSSPWRRQGYGQWGTGVMQTDVDDAVTYLREQGLASQICIAGWSYGGYSALAGATFTPDLYDCAISINGVSDLPQLLEYVDDRYGPDSQSARYWSNSITGETTDGVSRDQMRALSPSQSAEAVNIPVLLVHARDDTVVPMQQSYIMDRNLRRAGGDVEFVRLDGGDHWALEYPTRLSVLQSVEAFLEDNLAE